MSQIDDVSPICCVLFGAPGTGKTTTLRLLAESGRGNAEGGFLFATIEEPTNQPHIVELLKQMYAETPESIANNGSIAFEVQCAILRARVKSYADFTRTQLRQIGEAARERNKRVVVVLDGHPLTDDLLYVASKHAAGQISAAQREAYTDIKTHALGGIGDLFGSPTVYCQIKIANDPSGAEHHKRVCVQRKNAAEEGVDTKVFADLAKFADRAMSVLLDTRPHGDELWVIDSQQRTPENVRDQLIDNLSKFYRTLPSNE